MPTRANYYLKYHWLSKADHSALSVTWNPKARQWSFGSNPVKYASPVQLAADGYTYAGAVSANVN